MIPWLATVTGRIGLTAAPTVLVYEQEQRKLTNQSNELTVKLEPSVSRLGSGFFSFNSIGTSTTHKCVKP